jgi:4-oxalocrotonate tautomerase
MRAGTRLLVTCHVLLVTLTPHLPVRERKLEPTLKGDSLMPVVHVEMWPGRTYAQKQELAKAITQAMVDIVKTTPEATIVIFSDVPKENWAQAGELASET